MKHPSKASKWSGSSTETEIPGLRIEKLWKDVSESEQVWTMYKSIKNIISHLFRVSQFEQMWNLRIVRFLGLKTNKARIVADTGERKILLVIYLMMMVVMVMLMLMTIMVLLVEMLMTTMLRRLQVTWWQRHCGAQTLLRANWQK